MKKITTILVLLATLLVACQQKNTTATTVANPAFSWNAGVNAPRGYEMQIMATYVFGNNGSYTFSVSQNRTDGGWGLGSGIGDHNDHIHLPTEVLVNSLSKTEGKYYKTTVKIDTVKIRQLIAKGCGIDQYTNEPILYRYVSVGAAPGGTAAVWLQSENNNHMIGWAKGVEDLNPPELGYLDFREEVKMYKEKPFYGGLWNGVSVVMHDESINCVAKNGIPLDSWDYYPKQYDWQPVVLSSKEYQIDNGYLFTVNPVTGGRDDISMIMKDGTSLGPASISWNEVLNFNSFKAKRSLPSFIEFSYYSTKDKDKGTLVSIMLPIKKLYDCFEKGFQKKNGTKGNYNKIIFEVNRQKKIKIWLFGDLQNKILIKEIIGIEENRINF